ncbi:MAG TPA: D-alanine--D-alanine ligase [Candidatus Paceibacterota bacterium]|jgi:D-alanine--D-alanine ligase|nr:D-alanine--D-alanine ligase [Candidatus Paceibacterota bacterium]
MNSGTVSPQHKLRVGVLRGGPSNEYEVSIKTGASVLRNLPEKYQPQDIFISKQGDWHIDGVARPPEKILQRVDVVWNALHGEYGEDGRVQKLLSDLNMPFTGSDALASAVGMNKLLAKKTFAAYGLKTPFYAAVKRGENTAENAHQMLKSFTLPVIVKPAASGSSVGVSLAADLVTLIQALEMALAISEVALVEEYIRGKEATVGVIDGFREAKHYALLPVEIIHGSSFFDYNAKYSPETREVSPGNFSSAESRELEELAVRAHRALGMRHYSRSDFIVSPNGIYILETNSLPGLTEHSLIPKSLETVGSSLPEFLDHVITLAIR